MCFHYSITKEKAAITDALGVVWDGPWEPVYHADGFSFSTMPLITAAAPTIIQQFNWGLIPHWVKTKTAADELRTQTLNARAETVFERPSFRTYIPNNRCLIPADGFFEWMDFQKKKYPHYIYLKNNSLFCFAGIYSSWTDHETGEHIDSFSILTTEANPLMARIHNLKKRMPVILAPNDYARWLQPDLPKTEIQSLLHAFPENDMQYHTIGKQLSARNGNAYLPEILNPVMYPELAFAE